MKQPKKLTRTQKELLSAQGYVADGWMLIEETERCLTIINKESGETNIADKYTKKGARKNVRKNND